MYEIREIAVKRGEEERSLWVIEFEDSSYDIIGEFLMTDAPTKNYRILEDLNKVLNEEEISIKISGNRCSLKISKNQTKMEDLFDGLFEDLETYSPIEIDTQFLRDLILEWKERTEN